MSTLVPTRLASHEYLLSSRTSDSASAFSQALAAAVVPTPFRAGEQVRIPAGTLIHTMEPGKRFKRYKDDRTVVIDHEYYGYVDCAWGSEGLSNLPTITWAGARGYWHTVQVTPEFAAANGRILADFTLTENQAHLLSLPVLPSWDAGYTDAWVETD